MSEAGPISPERLRQILQALGINTTNIDVVLSSRASEATLATLLTQTQIREALREELDLHSSFSWEKFLYGGLNANFICRVFDNVETKIHDPSTYWVQNVTVSPYTGQLTIPASLEGVAIYSKMAYKYPLLSTRFVQLPDLTGFPNATQVWIGFENGSGGGTGLACFLYILDTGVEYIRAVMWGNFGQANRYVDITALCPNYKTTQHRYSLHLTRSMAIYYYDINPVAFGLITPPNYSFASIVGPPYALFCVDNPVSPIQCALFEARGMYNALTVNLPPYGFRVSDGEPTPPMQIPVYTTGTSTKWAGLATNVQVTSHPIPIWGYSRKTLGFQSNAAGTLVIQIYAGGAWRTYDTPAIVAGTLLSYHFPQEMQYPIINLIYTPVGADTIAVAEVNLA